MKTQALSGKSDQQKRRIVFGDAYRLIFAGVGWVLVLVLLLSSSPAVAGSRPALYGIICLLAAYTIFALVIWRKNSR